MTYLNGGKGRGTGRVPGRGESAPEKVLAGERAGFQKEKEERRGHRIMGDGFCRGCGVWIFAVIQNNSQFI